MRVRAHGAEQGREQTRTAEVRVLPFPGPKLPGVAESGEPRSDGIRQFLVRQPILGPIVARPGQILSFWPEHPTHKLVTQENRPDFPLCAFATGDSTRLAGALEEWARARVIVPFVPVFGSFAASG